MSISQEKERTWNTAKVFLSLPLLRLAKPVAHPFGYGPRPLQIPWTLYDEEAEMGEARITVTNTGKTAGGEVVQPISAKTVGCDASCQRTEGF